MSKKSKISLKKIQEEIVGATEDIWLAGLGVFSTVEVEGSKLFEKFVDRGKDLVEKGKKAESKARKETKVSASAKLDGAVKFVEEKLQGLGSSLIEPLGISSREEVKELNEKVDKLTEMVMVLAQKIEEVKKPATTTSRAKKISA